MPPITRTQMLDILYARVRYERADAAASVSVALGVSWIVATVLHSPLWPSLLLFIVWYWRARNRARRDLEAMK